MKTGRVVAVLGGLGLSLGTLVGCGSDEEVDGIWGLSEGGIIISAGASVTGGASSGAAEGSTSLVTGGGESATSGGSGGSSAGSLSAGSSGSTAGDPSSATGPGGTTTAGSVTTASDGEVGSGTTGAQGDDSDSGGPPMESSPEESGLAEAGEAETSIDDGLCRVGMGTHCLTLGVEAPAPWATYEPRELETFAALAGETLRVGITLELVDLVDNPQAVGGCDAATGQWARQYLFSVLDVQMETDSPEGQAVLDATILNELRNLPLATSLLFLTREDDVPFIRLNLRADVPEFAFFLEDATVLPGCADARLEDELHGRGARYRLGQGVVEGEEFRVSDELEGADGVWSLLAQ